MDPRTARSSSAAPDVIVVGAGPAGAIAGLVAARAGARVVIIDRAAFPRDKLCGDTVNPGTLAILRRLGVDAEVEARGWRVDGMIVTGERGDRIVGRYPRGRHGRAIVRRELDAILLDAAVAAGCAFEPSVSVRRAVTSDTGDVARVSGVVVAGRTGERTLTAPVVVAADGRRSTMAFGLGLARHPASPRRWAIGAYFSGVADCAVERPGEQPAVLGEMHVRRDGYIGVAPVPGGATNVCLVTPSHAGDRRFQDPGVSALLMGTLAADPLLAARFADARLLAPPVVLGPLAVDVADRALDGLLLTGDAAGFIDPMTGDGLRFAIRGGELAGLAALRALEHGWSGVHAWHRAERTASFAGKWRFNRALRAVVGSPAAIEAAAVGARMVPAAMRAIVARAGDC